MWREGSASSLPSAEMLNLQLRHSAESLDKRRRGVTQKQWECDVTELRKRWGDRKREKWQAHIQAHFKCAPAMLHQWQFTRGTNRLIKHQTVMSRESEEHPTEQRGRKREQPQSPWWRITSCWDKITPSNNGRFISSSEKNVAVSNDISLVFH